MVAKGIAGVSLSIRCRRIISRFVRGMTIIQGSGSASLRILRVFLRRVRNGGVRVVHQLIGCRRIQIARRRNARVGSATFSPARFMCVAVLDFKDGWRILRGLKDHRLLTIARLGSLNSVLRGIGSFRLLIGLWSILQVMSRACNLSGVRYAAIELRLSRRCFCGDELPHAIVPRGSRLFVANRSMERVFRCLRIAGTLVRVVDLRCLTTGVEDFRFRLRVIVIGSLFNGFLRFVGDVFAVPNFISTYLERAARPIRLNAVWVIHALCLSQFHFSTFLTFLRVVAMVSFMLVGLTIICLSSFKASAIRGMAIVHRRRRARIHATGVLFRPFNRIRVRVINELIRGRRVQFNGRDVNRDCPLGLSSKRVLRLLIGIPCLRLQGCLFDLLFVLPNLFVIRACRRIVRSQVSFNFRTPFMLFCRLRNAIAVIGTNFRRDRFFKVLQVLFRVVGPRIATRRGVTTVVSLLSKRCVWWNNFTHAIFDSRTSALTFNGARKGVFRGGRVTGEFNGVVCLWVENRGGQV